MTKNELNNVDDYKRIQDEKSSLDDQISTTEKNLKKLEDKKDPSDDDKAKIESYKQELNTLRGSYEDLNDEEKKYYNGKHNSELFNICYDLCLNLYKR